MAVENFTSYVENDPDGKLSVAASKITFTNAETRLETYGVYKDKGAGYFGNFDHLITVFVSAHTGNALAAFWALANVTTDIAGMYTDTHGLGFYDYAPDGALYIEDFNNVANTDGFVFSLSTVYYCRLQRVGSVFTCKIYSDAARTVLLDTLTTNCDTTAFRYVYGFTGYDSNQSGKTATGYSENLDLQDGVVSITASRNQFEIELYNKNGDLKKILTKQAIVSWEYLRTGGCGQLDMATQFKVGGEIDRMLRPGDEVRVKIRQELRYSGKLLKIRRRITRGKDGLDLTFYGYSIELNDPIVSEEYSDMEVSAIVRDILDNKIVGATRITYDSADIEETDYAVQLLSLNHSVMDAMALLGGLAGPFEWGVDRNKKFYFKRRDNTTRRTFNIGREIYDYEEIEDHEAVKNKAFVYGSDQELLSTVNSSESATIFGSRQFNIFESAISEQSDASRLGIVNVKSRANRSRQIKIKTRDSDFFLERSHPIGAVAVVLEPFSTAGKYGNNFKYGENQKYGNIKEDQVETIRYTMVGGGLDMQIAVSEDVPNQGEQQKQVEFQIKELQRR